GLAVVVVAVRSDHAVVRARLVDRGQTARCTAIVDDIRLGIPHALRTAAVEPGAIPSVAFHRTSRRSKRADVVEAGSEDALVSTAGIDDARGSSLRVALVERVGRAVGDSARAAIRPDTAKAVTIAAASDRAGRPAWNTETAAVATRSVRTRTAIDVGAAIVHPVGMAAGLLPVLPRIDRAIVGVGFRGHAGHRDRGALRLVVVGAGGRHLLHVICGHAACERRKHGAGGA